MTDPIRAALERLLARLDETTDPNGPVPAWSDSFYAARAAIALDRSHQPAPPAEGEVGELVAALRADAECAEVEHYDLCNMTADQMRRAADLLERGQSTLHRLHRLQQENARFREPERTILCDILANGMLLPDPDGKRYGVPPIDDVRQPDGDVAELVEHQQPVPVAIPGEEYHEDMGPVTWWRLPVDEPPWVGTPSDWDWPGYHTHFTPAPIVPLNARALPLSGVEVQA